MSDSGRYRVGMVAKMTGLSTHTLRMWEKRHAAVLPTRTEAGGRLYSDDDVQRLRLLHQLVRSGHSIGGIAKLSDEDLRHMAATVGVPMGASAAQHLPDVRARVMQAIERLQVEEAEQVLMRAALSTEPVEFLHEVVAPTLVEVGDRWERGELRIAHEHACSTVMRGLLFSLMRLYPASQANRRAVVATPASEDHELGAQMVAMLAAMYGWSVLYLGPSLPADEIAFAVTDTDAELLMMSITNLEPDEAAAEVAAIEQQLPKRVRLLVGGRGAPPEGEGRAEVQQDLRGLETILSR